MPSLYEETLRCFAAKLGVDPSDLPLTLPVAKAGRAAYNLSAPRSYMAVKDGSLETIVVAGRMRVPTLKLVKKLAAEAA
jgi:hypothetical protein